MNELVIVSFYLTPVAWLREEPDSCVCLINPPSPSLNQSLLLERERLVSDLDQLKAESQEKDVKLQKLT